jgi:hypothetical protein
MVKKILTRLAASLWFYSSESFIKFLRTVLQLLNLKYDKNMVVMTTDGALVKKRSE